jgi:hypothetical protein
VERDNIALLSILPEGVYNLHAIDESSCLQIFGEEHFTPSLLGHPHDQRIPEGKPVKAVEVDGGHDVSKLRSSNVKLGQQFNLAASNRRFNVQLLGDRDEILLQDLERNNAGPCTPVLCQEVKGASLLRRC